MAPNKRRRTRRRKPIKVEWQGESPLSSKRALRSAFRRLETFKDVASILGFGVTGLVELLHRTTPSSRYTAFTIPKRRGGVRAILAPVPELKFLQRRLSAILYAVHVPTFQAHGFLPKRGIVTNASPHVARRYVCNVDLEDFFGSIHFGRVRGLFLARPFELPAVVATTLAQLSCHANALPQGAPTSPILSNMIASSLDGVVATIAIRNGCRYTRYADDLTFSTDRREFPEAIMVRGEDGALRLGDALANAIEEQGFRPNNAKLRLSCSRQRQEVTGLIVNELVNVRREYIRQIRAMIHAIRKFGDERATIDHYRLYSTVRHRFEDDPWGVPTLSQIVQGKLEFVASTLGHDSPVYENLRRQFDDAMWDYE